MHKPCTAANDSEYSISSLLKKGGIHSIFFPARYALTADVSEATSTRLRPPVLAQYSEALERRITCSAFSCAPRATATPALPVTRGLPLDAI